MATEASALLSSVEKGGDVDGPLPPVESVTRKEIIVNILAGISVILQTTGIYFYGRTEKLVKESLGMGCLIAPICAVQQRAITTVVNMNEARKRLHQEVNELAEDNRKLDYSVKDIEENVSKMEQLEEALRIVKETKVLGLEMLEEEVERSREVLEEMEENVESKTMQNIIEMIFAVDKNNDMKLDYDEITTLIENLSSLQNVTVNEVLFRKKIQSTDRSVDAVTDIVRSILQENNDSDEKILTMVK